MYHPPVLVIQPRISLFFHSFSTYELFFLSKGFLPTYGPCWVNLYGSTRQYSLLNENQHLNDGLGEGVSYRGRMLISLRTEVIESADLGGPATVEVCSALPISDVSWPCINAWYNVSILDTYNIVNVLHFAVYYMMAFLLGSATAAKSITLL